MPRNIPKNRKAPPGPFIITDSDDQPLRDANGAVRVFSTVARATPHLRPGDKVAADKR
jgi:hypothetical protein